MIKTKQKDNNIDKIIIERNKYHPKYFTKKIIHKDKSQTMSGGYDSPLKEIVAEYLPRLDRFDKKTQELLMKDIYNAMEEVNKKLQFCMDFCDPKERTYIPKELHKELNKLYTPKP